jgi:hypothetical protein
MNTAHALAFVVLIGCGASQLPAPGADTGNYLRKPPGQLESVMAVDAADLIYRLRPPTNPFQVLPPRRDAFGAKLVAELEGHGYSVVVGGAPDASFKQLRYVVESSDDGRFFMTVRIDGDPMSRAYQCAGQECLPAGAWTVATAGPESPR